MASSRIEGTETSLEEVLRAEAAGAAPNEDVAEVDRCIQATRLALQLVGELPLAQRLVKRVHATAPTPRSSVIRDAERRGWLTALDVRGRSGRAYWYAHDVFRILDVAPLYLDGIGDGTMAGQGSIHITRG